MPDFLRRLLGRKPSPRLTDEDVDLEQFFTDAEHALQVFEQLVSAARLPKCLLVIHGVGGVGKSTVLKMYRLSCRRQRIPVALVGGEEAPSPVDVLADWANDLSDYGVKLSTFQDTLTHYRALQAKVEAKAKEAGQAVEKLGKAAAKTAVEMAASAIPVVGPLATALGSAGAEAFMDWLRGFLSKPDLELYLDPSKRLTNDFLSDLTRAATGQRIVLMADTYEQMTTLGDWVGDLAQRLPENVLLVIAGRAMPEWERAWPGWMGRAEIVELKEMTPNELRTLVHRYYAHIRDGEPNPGQVEAVVRFARGLPMAATTVVQLWVRHGMEDFEAVRPQVVADLVDRLLEGGPPEMRPAFEVAAVLRYFNADSLQMLLDGGDADRLYAELRRWPFMRSRREGLAVHDTMREMMNEALRVRTPERFRTLHERAAVYYEARLEKATSEERERLLLERLYHKMRADWWSGINLCVLAVEEAASLYALAFGDLLVRELSAPDVGRDSSRYIYYAKGLLSLARNNFDEAVPLLQEALASQVAPDELRFKTTERLARTLTLQGKLEEALQYYEECVRLSAESREPLWQIRAWNGIETVLRRLGYISKAIEALRNSIATCGNTGMENSFEMAWAQDSLGLALGIAGLWQQAVFHHQRALRIYQALGNDYNAAIVLHNMTRIKSKWGKSSNQVLDDFQTALSVFKRLGDDRWIRYCRLSIAETLIDLAQIEEAGRYLKTEGIDDATAQIWSNRLLGDIQRYKGKWDESLVSYKRALHIAEKQRRNRDKTEILIRLSSLLLQGNFGEIYEYVVGVMLQGIVYIESKRIFVAAKR
ncbi:MAG: tetratricopeptide repeat protein [Anaerolineae bacterium]|nr:tetratricopeptide repeat protein [Anaerolineae bacterium]